MQARRPNGSVCAKRITIVRECSHRTEGLPPWDRVGSDLEHLFNCVGDKAFPASERAIQAAMFKASLMPFEEDEP